MLGFSSPGSAMRPSLLATALLASLVAGCQATPSVSAATAPASTEVTTNASADAKFADLSRRWLDGWMRLNPVSATQLGDHRFDSDVDDLSADGRQRMVDFSQRVLAELDAMDVHALTREFGT